MFWGAQEEYVGMAYVNMAGIEQRNKGNRPKVYSIRTQNTTKDEK